MHRGLIINFCGLDAKLCRMRQPCSITEAEWRTHSLDISDAHCLEEHENTSHSGSKIFTEQPLASCQHPPLMSKWKKWCLNMSALVMYTADKQFCSAYDVRTACLASHSFPKVSHGCLNLGSYVLFWVSIDNRGIFYARNGHRFSSL